jgi:hypothetical protein
MKSLCISTVLVALAVTAAPTFAQKSIGKCVRPDCESMQQYCDESRSAGKTGTDCSVAGKLCFQSKGRTWVGTTPDGRHGHAIFSQSVVPAWTALS